MSVQVTAFEKAAQKPSKLAGRLEEIVGDGFDVKKFVENFDVLVNVAGSTKHLKELVLQLAMRGRLVTQARGDEPAAHLLARLRNERMKSRGAASKSTAPVEPLFPLPASWEWVRIDQLWRSITDGDHQPPPKSERGVAFLTIGNLSGGKLDFTATRYVPEAYFSVSLKKRPIESS